MWTLKVKENRRKREKVELRGTLFKGEKACRNVQLKCYKITDILANKRYGLFKNKP